MGILSSLLGINQGQQSSIPGSSVTEPTIAKEISPFLQDILKKGQALYKTRTDEGFQPYTGQTIADLTPEQLQAREVVKAQIGQQAPVIQEAQTLVRGTTERPTTEVLQAYMNPYQQAVTDIAKRQATEQFQQTTLPGLRKQAIDAGAFGGSRAAMRESQAQDSQARLLADIQAKGDLAAFQNAQQQFAAQKAREAGAASGLTSLAETGFGAGLKEAAALQTVGEEDQRRQQMALDESYKQFLQEKQFPETELAKYQAIVGQFPIPAGSITTSPPPPQPSTLATLAGTGLAGANIYGRFGGFSPGGLGSGYFGAAQGGSIIPSQSGGLINLPVVQKDIGGQTIEDRRTRGERIKDFISRNIFSGPQASEKLKAILAGEDISNMNLTEEGPTGIVGPDGYGIELGRDGNVEKVSIPNLEYADDNVMLSTQEQLAIAREEADKKRRGFDPREARSPEVTTGNIMSVENLDDDTLQAIKENAIKSATIINKTPAGPAFEQVKEEIEKRKKTNPLDDKRINRIFPSLTKDKDIPEKEEAEIKDPSKTDTNSIINTLGGSSLTEDEQAIKDYLTKLDTLDADKEALQEKRKDKRTQRIKDIKSQYKQDMITGGLGAASEALLSGKGFTGALTAISKKLETIENPKEKLAVLEDSGIVQDITDIENNQKGKLSRLLASKNITDGAFTRGMKVLTLDAEIKRNLLLAAGTKADRGRTAVTEMRKLLASGNVLAPKDINTIYISTLRNEMPEDAQKAFDNLMEKQLTGESNNPNESETFKRTKP